MRNHAPIFINGFGRGGTNLLLNLLLSHPGVCMPSGETHQVFKGDSLTDPPWRILQKGVFYDLPILVTLRQDFFSPRLLEPRKKVPRRLQRFIDWVLFTEKRRATHENHNRFRGPGIEYTREEIIRSRLVCKNLDGLVYATELFREMYPQAVFLGLVRNGLALCEGHLRRGRPAPAFGEWYQRVATQMLRDAERFPNYTIVRFEDLLADPSGFLQWVYKVAGLDLDQVPFIRLQQKKTITSEGQRILARGHDRQLVWYDRDQFAQHLQPDINRNQIRRLDPADRRAFLQVAQEAMERLNYL